MILHEKAAIAITEYLREHPEERGQIKTRGEVYAIASAKFPEISLKKNNVPPSDICWNSVNNKPGTKIYDDFANWPHALERVGREYRLVGSDIAYTGIVIHAKTKQEFGHWENGEFYKN